MLNKAVFLALLVLSLSIDYPLFKQNDQQWSSQHLGTSSTDTIGSSGCVVSSIAMALYVVGKDTEVNPSSLNKWLTTHGGYVQDDVFVWGSINEWGVTFQGLIADQTIKNYIGQSFFVLLNVMNGKHWVLAKDYNGDRFEVNDPLQLASSYALSQVVNAGVYKINS